MSSRLQEIKRSRYLELRFSTNLRLWWLRNILQLYGFGARGPILTQVTPGAMYVVAFQHGF
jgi:hypothetical protein